MKERAQGISDVLFGEDERNMSFVDGLTNQESYGAVDNR